MHVWIVGLVRRLRIWIMLPGGFDPHVAASYIPEARTVIAVYRSLAGSSIRVTSW